MELKVDNESIEKLVAQHIHLAVAEAVSKKSEFFVEQIVKAALEKPVLDGYGHPVRPPRTIIENATEKMICEAANDAAKEWLEAQRPRIKELVRKHLDSKSKGLTTAIANQLTAKFETGFDVTVWVRGSGDR